MKHEEVVELLKKYASGDCNDHEKGLVESFYMNYEDGSLDDLTDEQIEILVSPKDFEFKHYKGYKIWSRALVAACLLVVAGIGFYFYKSYDTPTPIVNSGHDIAPGGNKAFLTLANGKRIILTGIKNGEIAEQSGVKVTKTADGQLIYTVVNVPNEGNKINDYNTIETPRGGTYQVRLPDGTKVWLNAASTIKYPVSFSSQKERRIRLLSGEAYFEVAKDKKHPFIVQTDKQEVEVLGTHFNVNSYNDEFFTRTTLLEGSIRISPLEKDGTKGKSELLKPNQQAVLNGKSLEVINTDIEEAVAWKSGYFKFQNERIETVMKKIARWYNVKVQYAGIIPTEGLGGTMSREQNLSKLLDILQSTGLVKFRINGDVVIVSK